MTTPTTLASVRDQVCCWFGGAYDPPSRSYRNPQVPGLGAVRRARPKAQDDADYYLGQAEAGSLCGAQMLVHVDSGVETRAAMAGAFAGLKLVNSNVVLHVFLRSHADYSEDGQDAFYDLLDALKARIRADRCMGTGGFEQGGFDVAENAAGLRWQMAPAETTSEMTSSYLSIEFTVRYYEEG